MVALLGPTPSDDLTIGVENPFLYAISVKLANRLFPVLILGNNVHYSLNSDEKLYRNTACNRITTGAKQICLPVKTE